jgi:hypothetical protein
MADPVPQGHVPQRRAPGHRRRADPPGPVVAVCTGRHCLHAHRIGPGQALDLAELRESVRRTRGGVLVSCGCLGRCGAASLVLLGWQGNAYVEFRALGGMERGQRMSTLAAWLPGPGPAKALLDGGDLPRTLAQAEAETDADADADAE